MMVSVQKYGWINPGLIDSNQASIARHCRFLAAQLLGMAKSTAVHLQNSTRAQIRAYVITNNKLLRMRVEQRTVSMLHTVKS